jgi:hypothetical protein
LAGLSRFFAPAFLLVAGAMLSSACRPVIGDLDRPGPVGQAPAAEELFTAFARRYTNVERTARHTQARRKLAEGALIPSRVFSDTTAWSTIPSATVRMMFAEGRTTGDGYRLRMTPTPATYGRAGDARHTIMLGRLGQDVYRWDTNVDFTLGRIGAVSFAGLIGSFAASAEGRRDRELRADYGRTMPRTATALGKLFSIESLHSAPRDDGSSEVTLVVALSPARLSQDHPLFAAWVERYISGSRMSLTLRDRQRAGAPQATWFVLDARSNRITMRLRSRDGSLQPFTGSARPLPDTLELETTAIARGRGATVGFERLRSDFIITRRERERAWTVVSRQEPEWVLPMFTATLLRAPLRRPFMGNGSSFRIGVHEERGVTVLSRRATLTVQESTVLRFVGRLGARAFNELEDETEADQYRWLRSVFTAMLADSRALRGSPAD